MRVIAVLAVFALSAISATTGLRCFECTYVEGTSENDDCVTIPPDTDLQTCPGTRAVSDESTHVSKIRNALLNGIEGWGHGTSRGIGDMYCAKITSEVHDEKVVVRSCVAAEVVEDLNGKCETQPDICHDGVCVRKWKACYCNSDACHPNDNGPTIGTTTTTNKYNYTTTTTPVTTTTTSTPTTTTPVTTTTATTTTGTTITTTTHTTTTTLFPPNTGASLISLPVLVITCSASLYLPFPPSLKL